MRRIRNLGSGAAALAISVLIIAANATGAAISDRIEVDLVISSGNPLVATVTPGTIANGGLKTIDEGAAEDSVSGQLTVMLNNLRCGGVERGCAVSGIVFPDSHFNAGQIGLTAQELATVLIGVNSGVALPSIILNEPGGETNDRAVSPSDVLRTQLFLTQQGNPAAAAGSTDRLDLFALQFTFASDTTNNSPTVGGNANNPPPILETGADQDLTCMVFTACAFNAAGVRIPTSVPFIVTVASDAGNNAVVPEPGTWVLFGSGLISLVVYRRRQTRAFPPIRDREPCS